MLYLLVADSHCVSWNESVQFLYETHSMELKSQHQYYAVSTRVDDDDTAQYFVFERRMYCVCALSCPLPVIGQLELM